MRLVAVTRVLNEDDLIEAFLRHHAPIVDHHILLDNGSTDRTIAIMRAMKDEGLRITVLQNRSPMFAEKLYNTMLFRMAAKEFAADWVLCLDCDEFLDERRVEGGLRGRLATVGDEEMCLHVPWAHYHRMPQDDATELIVPRRIKFREPEIGGIAKVCVRGALAAHGLEIDAGSHHALWHGNRVAARACPDLPLAHYYARSSWQMLSKAVIGRLKVLAAGQAEIAARRNDHYTPTFEKLRDDPTGLFHEVEGLDRHGPSTEVIADPIRYGGDELRYTTPTDPMAKAAQIIAAHAEELAQQHGRLLDGNAGARMVVENMAAQWTRLI
jgi:hypothetical protein